MALSGFSTRDAKTGCRLQEMSVIVTYTLLVLFGCCPGNLCERSGECTRVKVKIIIF